MKLLLIYSLIIILKAIADGLNDTGHKGYGHALTSLWIALLISVPYITDLPIWRENIIAFTLLMIAFFDYAYNIFRGLPINFVGTTSWWDIAIKKVPFGFMLFGEFACLNFPEKMAIVNPKIRDHFPSPI